MPSILDIAVVDDEEVGWLVPLLWAFAEILIFIMPSNLYKKSYRYLFENEDDNIKTLLSC